MSGLTVGYLSIDELALELKSINGTEEEKANSKIIQDVLSSRHKLLVTLLLSNAAAMEALPIYLHYLVPEWAAILVSIILVFFMGEVIPQALCTGPNQIKIASKSAPLTKILILILYPANEPIAWALDKLLGVHSRSRLMNNDLRILIELHTHSALKRMNLHQDDQGAHIKTDSSPPKKATKEEFGIISESHEDDSSISLSKPLDLPMKRKPIDNENFDNPSSNRSGGLDDFGLNEEQANLMVSAIEMKDKCAKDVMISITKTYMISYDDPLDNVRLSVIIERGFSRIPVYASNNVNDILGLVRIKKLIGLDLSEKKSMRQMGIQLSKPLVISPKMNLLDLLKEFKKGKSHMAFITDNVRELQIKLGLNRSNSVKGGNQSQSKQKANQAEISLIGIVTLEDVIEKMINIEIYDEDDYDLQAKSRRNNIRSKFLAIINI